MYRNTLKEVYATRPFKTRNADEYEIESILDLFIDPTDGLICPFDYDNMIVKGKMGSGKTMYLRANLAYYLYDLIPCIMENDPIILPIYIKLSDFQNITDSETIYSSVIVKIIEEMANICIHLTSSETLAKLHKGFIALPYGILGRQSDIERVKQKLNEITADEYVEKVTNEFSTSGRMGNDFINACTSYSKGLITELKKRGNPKFDNICEAYEILLKPFNGKLLILFDEVGSINKNFFKEGNCDSVFEILMNQLRTLDFVGLK